MTKAQRLTLSGSLYVAGAIVAVYGAGFSWRQITVGGIALLIWQSADEAFKAAFAKPAFTRFQFRIGIEHIGLALEKAGLYGDELAEAAVSVCEGMTGKGWIVFTWLEPELFYINTTQQFTSQLETNVDLPPFGKRHTEERRLSDTIEIRSTTKGYEVVLLTREERYCWPDTTRDKGLVLFDLPYKFFWSLQGDPFASHEKAKSILQVAGLNYWADEEVLNAWGFQNEYGSFRWWNV